MPRYKVGYMIHDETVVEAPDEEAAEQIIQADHDDYALVEVLYCDLLDKENG